MSVTFETNDAWPQEANAAIMELVNQRNDYSNLLALEKARVASDTQAIMEWELKYDQATERVADLETRLEREADFKERLTKRLHELAEEQEWCSDFDREMERFGLPGRGGWKVRVEMRPIIYVEFEVGREDRHTIEDRVHGEHSELSTLVGFIESEGWQADQMYVYDVKEERLPYNG